MKILKYLLQLKFLALKNRANYCLSKNKMDLGIFVITQERKELESCGFRHSIDDREGHRVRVNFIVQYIDQLGSFLEKHY